MRQKPLLSLLLVTILTCCSLLTVSVAQENIKVGVIIPLSGSLAEYGTALKNAIELARIDDSKSMRILDIIYEDSQSDPKLALSAFNKITSSPIDLVYVWGATPSETIAPVAEGKKIPLLAMSVSPTVAKDRQYVLRTVGTADELIAPLGKYLINSNYKKIALAKTQWTYTEELSKSLKKILQDRILVTEYDFNREDRDFRTALLKIAEYKPDVVGVFLGSSQVSAFFQQQRQLKQSYPSFGADFFASQKEINDSGPNIEGAIFPHYLFCEEFTKKYIEKYGNDTHIAHAINLYDIIKIVSSNALILENDKTNSLLQLLKSGVEIRGVCSNFKYKYSSDTGGYFDYPTSLYKINNSKVSIFKE